MAEQASIREVEPEGRVICGHTNGDFTCYLPPGHRGLHDEPFRTRTGHVEHTNWGDDGLAIWATKDTKRLKESRRA